MGWMLCILFVFGMGALAFRRSSLAIWTLSLVVWVCGVLVLCGLFWYTTLIAALALIFLVVAWLPPLRRLLISQPVMSLFRQLMPAMSETERAALLAGDVSWEGQLFSGRPDWGQLLNKTPSSFTPEEQAFLDGPVEELCARLNEWEISFENRAIPDSILEFVKSNGFFGMIIPKQYGGLEFSAYAHSQVIVKLATVSVAVATAVSVPNSLGPAELLLHYGTEEQKDYYLPRLAAGQDIPCFALTSTHAGSDAAGSMRDHGIVCRDEFDGKEQLCIRLTWSKRYITLCPIATLLGLAFKLYDPDHLLGSRDELGITCALIPVTTKGVVTGRRHYPLMSAFPNGPTEGKEVLIPLDWIIGGRQQAGRGWTMLMQCLAAGRGISLPSMAMGGAKKAVYTSGAYAQIRQQFGVPIAQFDGIQAELAKAAGYGFLMEALRLFVVADIDQGHNASVASAIAKAYTTEWSRTVVTAAMDIQGGKAICMGPSNFIAQSYIETPICITVEGANILTRSLIIFGQGLIRCHPYLFQEIEASQAGKKGDLKAFDKALMSHIGYAISNALSSFIFGLTGSHFASVPESPYRRYMQKMVRYSNALGFLSDISMLLLGGRLKRMERLSERMGAIVGHLYSASAVLHWVQHHKNSEMEPFAEWALTMMLAETKQNIVNFLDNFPKRGLGRFLRVWLFPLGLHIEKPTDEQESMLARAITADTHARNTIVDMLYRKPGENNPVGLLEETLSQVYAAAGLEKKLMQAKKSGKLTGHDYSDWVESARKQGLITSEESEQLLKMNAARMRVIQVDDFSDDELSR